MNQNRLIPTCVGSTVIRPISASASAAHPHVCGEHDVPRNAPVRELGSSPRVWGAPPLRRELLPLLRLIPTCVGSTFCACP